MKDNRFYPEEMDPENLQENEDVPTWWLAVVFAALLTAFIITALIAYGKANHKEPPEKGWRYLADPEEITPPKY